MTCTCCLLKLILLINYKVIMNGNVLHNVHYHHANPNKKNKMALFIRY
jgi:hypothetical protein